ncbi:MAG: DeoR/GlpR transcriptional regulator [Clostridia bacterium]|nr:DeoR/GlpR transcriptional regulator [Clostridia bacterium]
MNTAVEQRRAEMVELLQKRGSVRVAELSRMYGISEVTVRSDLEYLESQGQLTRVHGGAVGTGKLYANMDLSERYMTNAPSKRALASSAAELIENNDTIMINAGTTLAYVLHCIRGKKNISIVTNSIQNALEVASLPGVNVILLGGEIDGKYQFTYGSDTVAQLSEYHANKCILSVDGIDKEDGLTLYYSNEAGIVRGMIKASDEVIVVADATKLGRSAFSRVAKLSDVDILVTGKKEGSAEIAALKKLGAEVIEVEI